VQQQQQRRRRRQQQNDAGQTLLGRKQGHAAAFRPNNQTKSTNPA
jgi:hypothetical protein